jgi:RNA polymerase sigma factor (sigma-70 family)
MVRLMYGDRFTGEFRPHESPLMRWLQYRGERKMSLYRFVQWNVNHYLRDLLRANGNQVFWNSNLPTTQRGEESPVIVTFSDTLGSEEQLQLRRCIRFCWKEMNPWYREVLELVGVMGYSQTEAAQKLGISVATVNRWFSAARHDLRTCLEYNCPERILPFPTEKLKNEKRA